MIQDDQKPITGPSRFFQCSVSLEAAIIAQRHQSQSTVLGAQVKPFGNTFLGTGCISGLSIHLIISSHVTHQNHQNLISKLSSSPRARYFAGTQHNVQRFQESGTVKALVSWRRSKVVQGRATATQQDGISEDNAITCRPPCSAAKCIARSQLPRKRLVTAT